MRRPRAARSSSGSGNDATDGIDCHNGSGGSSSYRPNPSGLATENAGDLFRPAYGAGLQDYNVGWNNGGNWGNYTRTYPTGAYYVYMRAASPNGNPATTNAADLSVVIAGVGTSNQVTKRLGTFTIPNTGDWHRFTWVPLLDSQGNLARVTNSGAIKTFRVTTVNGGYNVNFYELVPLPSACSLSASLAEGQIILQFPTQPGLSYQLECRTNLANPGWTPWGSPISGDGGVHSVMDAIAGSRFYRLQIR